MKIIYLRVAELNEKWSHRVVKGYYKCKDQIKEMFREGILRLYIILNTMLPQKALIPRSIDFFITAT
jgi:hypothetical protein